MAAFEATAAEAADSSELLSMYGSFAEGGYLVEAFMPAGYAQPQQWTVRFYKTGLAEPEPGDIPVAVVTVPMVYAPRFGPDAGDVAALEQATDELLAALPG